MPVSEFQEIVPCRTMCKAMRGKPRFSGDPKMLGIPRICNVSKGKLWESRIEVLTEI